MATYPKIHLAMDNAFASKRWTTPDEWARIIRDCGVRCIEASADAEADPFTCGPDYMDQWAREVVEASRKYGVSVVNLYTGVTTYRTLGLAHPDVRVRQRVMNEWLMVMARAAARTHSGLGFYLHAMSEKVLQDPDLYAETRDKLWELLLLVTMEAVKPRVVELAVMYCSRSARVEPLSALFTALMSMVVAVPEPTWTEMVPVKVSPELGIDVSVPFEGCEPMAFVPV